MPRILIIVVVVLAALIGGYFLLSNQGGEPVNTGSGKNPVAVMVTNMGTIKVELFLDKVPITAQNFIDLAEDGFYDGLIFHRIVAGFVVQGGDPEGTGMGGPGHTIVREIHPDLRHDKAGMLAMARSQDPDSAGSQFYFTLVPTPQLDDGYAVFGETIEGLEVILAMGELETGEFDRPLDPPFMEKVTIEYP